MMAYSSLSSIDPTTTRLDKIIDLLGQLVNDKRANTSPGIRPPQCIGKIPGYALNDKTLFRYIKEEGCYGYYLVEGAPQFRYTPGQLLDSLTQVVASLKCAGVE